MNKVVKDLKRIKGKFKKYLDKKAIVNYFDIDSY